MRKIPIKNYIIALIISLLTVVVVLDLMSIYNNRDTKIKFITEIKDKDVNYYIAENNDTLIYFSSGKKAKNIEKEFKEYLKDKEFNIIYIDLDDINDNFKRDFISIYVPVSYKLEITDPSLILIENKQVSNYLTNINDFTQIKDFIERSNIK